MADHLPRLLLIQGTAPVPVEDALLHQPVVAWHVPGTLGISKVFACALADGETAFYKPQGLMDIPHPQIGMPGYAFYGHHNAASVVVNEVAAWRMAKGLGAPFDTLVATSVARWVHGQQGLPADWGSFTRKGEGHSGDAAAIFDPDLRDPCAFFDALIGQQDRHPGNYRYDSGVLTLIDHGYAFPGGAWRFNQSVFLRMRHEHGSPALTDDERFILQQLPTYAVWRELSRVLRDDQFDALERRRAEMLRRGELLHPTRTDSRDLAP